MTSIAANAFKDVTGITTVLLPDSLITIGNNAFQKTSITSLTIPNNVLSIGSEAFYQTKIDTLDLGTSLQTIGNGSFDGIGPNRVDITIPNSVTTLGSGAFQQSRFGTVVIGTGLITIPTAAFYNNFGAGVTSLTIGSNVTTIGVAAFVGLRATEITIPNSVTNIGERVFEGSQLRTVTLSTNLSSMHTTAFQSSNLLSRISYCGANATIQNFLYPNSVRSACYGVPEAPTSLSATAGDGLAIITFTPGSDGGSAITNYKYSIDGSTYTALSPTDATSPITIFGLTNETFYTIYLKAVNANDDSSASSSVSVTPFAPPVSGANVVSSNDSSDPISYFRPIRKVEVRKQKISWEPNSKIVISKYDSRTKKTTIFESVQGELVLQKAKPGQIVFYSIMATDGTVLNKVTMKTKPKIPKIAKLVSQKSQLLTTNNKRAIVAIWKKDKSVKRYIIKITLNNGQIITASTTDPNFSIIADETKGATITITAVGINNLTSKVTRKI